MSTARNSFPPGALGTVPGLCKIVDTLGAASAKVLTLPFYEEQGRKAVAPAAQLWSLGPGTVDIGVQVGLNCVNTKTLFSLQRR